MPTKRRHIGSGNIDPEGIPERNIAFAQEKGLAYMELLRLACLEVVG